jgi:hypothetical protein
MVVLVEIYPTIPILFGHNRGSTPIGVWAGILCKNLKSLITRLFVKRENIIKM